MMSTQLSNMELLEQIGQGSTAAFDELYQRYRPFVLHISFAIVKDNMEAEEICHDVFLEIIRKAQHYQPDRGSVEAWIAIITKSRSKDLLRKKQRRQETEQEELLLISEQTPEHIALHHIQREELLGAVSKLPLPQKKALLGAYFQDKSHRELASDLQVPLGTVKSWVRYGIQNLRKQLNR